MANQLPKGSGKNYNLFSIEITVEIGLKIITILRILIFQQLNFLQYPPRTKKKLKRIIVKFKDLEVFLIITS